MQGYTIEIGKRRVAFDFDFIEGDAYVFGRVENAAQVGKILLLALLLILYPIGNLDVVPCGLADDFSGDDESIVAEYLLKEMYVLLVIRGAEMLHIVEYELTAAQVGKLKVAPDNVHIQVCADGQKEAFYGSGLIETDDCFLILCVTETAVLVGFHQERNVPDLISTAGLNAVLDYLLVAAGETAVLPQHLQ